LSGRMLWDPFLYCINDSIQGKLETGNKVFVLTSKVSINSQSTQFLYAYHLSFLARKDEVKCLHSLLIIMGYFLGQHNPSNYFALTLNTRKINRNFLRLIFQLILSVFFCYSSSFQFTSSWETTNAASLYSKCSTGYDFSGLV